MLETSEWNRPLDCGRKIWMDYTTPKT